MYNVEISKSKEKPLKEIVCPNFGRVDAFAVMIAAYKMILSNDRL